MMFIPLVIWLICGVWLIHCCNIGAFDVDDFRQAAFVKQLDDYEIIIPQKVAENGNFVSHKLIHEFHINRRKRGTDSRNSNENYSSDDLHGDVYYHINVSNRTLHLRLSPNRKLRSPGLVTERWKHKFGNISDVKIERHYDKSCHFIGKIKDQPVSKVAISTCNDGLTGFFHSHGDLYFIEPLRGHDDADKGRPHLVYKHSSLPAHLSGNEHDQKNKSSCGVDDNRFYEMEQEIRKRWQQKHRPTRSKRTRRRKRSVSVERNVEVLVVVDPAMMKFHVNEDIETYVLTIMNMVGHLYHDASIGNAINIVLVRLLLLEESQDDLKVTHHADNTLQSFCKWQHKVQMKDDKHANHHDVAILLTRVNICSRLNEPCSTLGLAQVSGMCQPHRSCNINEDTGLALAFTVAHELGHNFGMKHDSPTNGCEAPYGERQHVMSPQLIADNSPMAWSNCSRNSMTKFLDRDWGYCLEDEPGVHHFTLPEIPPGAMYDANHQCRLQYGAGAKHCEGIEEVCTTLWCKVNNKCMTRLEAAAEGTICGENRWCYAGECSLMGERPLSIDGEWSEWSEWTPCTRSCGAGVSYAERHCDNPPPSTGGKYCLGERKRFTLCNLQACDEKAESFRFQQCQEFNKLPYKKNFFSWEPVSSPATPCQLHCKPTNRFFSVMLKDIVSDGTPCHPGSRDMCISGQCKRIGCDWKIESAAKEDRCGVCHGDGSSCTTVKKKFTEKLGLGYVEATVFPKEARNIRIEEVAEANNYLALRNADGKYYLNGHWFIQWSGDYEAAGTIIHYKRQRNKESMFAAGPLKEPLYLMLLFQSQNPGVTYEYTVPNENTTARIPEFHWQYSDWSHCTVSCGGGTKRKTVVCMESEDGIVDERYCSPIPKPDDLMKSCNTHICPAQWWHGPWQHCSVTCGDGGTHRRSVICVRSRGPDEQIALDDNECGRLTKPAEEEPCKHKRKCPQAKWISGNWSGKCHGDPCGSMTRDVYCSDTDAGCDFFTKPIENKQCSNLTCGIWKIGVWSKCSSSCGEGLQFRRVLCVQGRVCPLRTKPADHRICEVICSTIVPASTSASTSTNSFIRKNHVSTDLHYILKDGGSDLDLSSATKNSFHLTSSAPITPGNDVVNNDYQAAIREDADEKNIAQNIQNSDNHNKNFLSENEISKADQDFLVKITGSSMDDIKRKISSSTIGLSASTGSPYSTTPRTSIKKITNSEFEPDLTSDIYDKAYNIGGSEDAKNVITQFNSQPDTDGSITSKPRALLDDLAVEDNDLVKNDKLVPLEIKGYKKIDVNSPSSATITDIRDNLNLKNFAKNNVYKSVKTVSVEKDIKPLKSRGEGVNKNNTKSADSFVLNEGEKHKKLLEGFYSVKQNYNEEIAVTVTSATTTKIVSSSTETESNTMLSPLLPTPTTIGYTPENIRNPKQSAGLPRQRQTIGKSGQRFQWMSLQWGVCSHVCGKGVKHRKIICVNAVTTNEINEKHCVGKPRPLDIQTCSEGTCLRWKVASWSECSTTCGHGMQQRSVECPKPNFCDENKMPVTERKCSTNHCIVWIAGSWSECSRTCGGGMRARHIQCVDQTSYQPSHGCVVKDKPEHEQHCGTEACPRQNAALMDWQHNGKCSVDKMSRHVCRVLKRLGHCTKRYVKIKCCRTCSQHDKRNTFRHIVRA